MKTLNDYQTRLSQVFRFELAVPTRFREQGAFLVQGIQAVAEEV